MYCDKEYYWAPECDSWEFQFGVSQDNTRIVPIDNLEEGEIRNAQDDDEILLIPKSNQCTMCGQLRLEKFRYCYPCMSLYYSKWYELYLITESNINAIHIFEQQHGYDGTSLHTKVTMHKNYGDPLFIAANRLGSIIAHQNLLPTHMLNSDSTIRHNFAAMSYLRSAVGKDNVWIDFQGCDLHITSKSSNIYIDMSTDNIMEQVYDAINILQA